VEIIRELDAEVIVEGVETEDQLELARHAGIYFVQGYLLSRPDHSLSWGAQPIVGSAMSQPPVFSRYFEQTVHG